MIFRIISEYKAIRKIGITEPEQYVKNIFSSLNVHYLSSCCISTFLLSQIESDVDDALRMTGYCDTTVRI